jgi:hypothetical protein
MDCRREKLITGSMFAVLVLMHPIFEILLVRKPDTDQKISPLILQHNTDIFHLRTIHSMHPHTKRYMDARNRNFCDQKFLLCPISTRV